MKVAVIIPAYNEEKHIAEVIIGTKQYVNYIFVIDDGSKDKTSEYAKKAGAVVLRHIVNMGKGVALKTGFEATSNFDVIITLDGDGQHDPKEIPRLLKFLEEQQADIVIGGRKLNLNMPVIFRLGNYALHKAFDLFFGASIHDTQSGYRAFRKGVYEKIKWETSGYSVETEMLIKARKIGLKCIEIPIDTVYLDTVKGTTILDGMKIFLDMVIWKFKR